MGESGVVFENKVDSTKPKIQVIPEVTIGGKSMSTVRLADVSHTAGVPILTHEEMETKKSIWKRIGFKIKRVFSRND